MTYLFAGQNFRPCDSELGLLLRSNLPSRLKDLLRIAMAIYSIDRLTKRSHSKKRESSSRDITATISVNDLQFWQSDNIDLLLKSILDFISGDTWHIQFQFEAPIYGKEKFFSFTPDLDYKVCLYSGGLDSAAGLAKTLENANETILAVTALHQAYQKHNVHKQLMQFKQVFNKSVISIGTHTTLMSAPKFALQEKTQRCRSFLFTSLGAAVAATVGVSEIEIYENGIGIVNLPLMSGMLVGNRTTRSCHPYFLHMMSTLVSAVADRPIRFNLPFENCTKAELVRSMSFDPILTNLALSTMSCVHYPLRTKEKAKQCGLCPGCIGRRQALISSGVRDDPENYAYDLFNCDFKISNVKLEYLKSTLFQVGYLKGINKGTIPELFHDHLYGTKILTPEQSNLKYVNLFKKYIREWELIIQDAQRTGLSWANWIND
jgi:7-cyano-7-deazaguanine synthase in queuosine biosynthesis